MPRKLVRRTPPPEKPEVLLETNPTDELVTTAFEVRGDATQLLEIWERSSPAMRKTLLSSLFDTAHRIRAVGLQYGGFNAKRGDAHDALKAKTLYLTGEPFDPSKRCHSITKAGQQCKNMTLVGEDHCHVPSHASEEERARSRMLTSAWVDHFNLLLTALDLRGVYDRIWEAIRTTKDL